MISIRHIVLKPEQLVRAKEFGKVTGWRYMVGPCVQDPAGIFKHHAHSWVRLGSHVLDIYI